jgi:hypothetical protein
MTPSLDAIRFRANPLVELKPLDEIPEAQRRPFRDLERDPEFYGLLVPKAPLRMNLLSVQRQTADFFRSLATPSFLDGEVLADEESVRDVVDLVLDGILEIERGDEFVSGADAMVLLCASISSVDPAARLSHAALFHAQDLETTDPETLTAALYGYNRIPISSFWKARFASREAILAHLGADRGSLSALLQRDWTASRSPGFLYWSPRDRMRVDANDVTYKLYVSPRPERIRDAFEIVVRVLSGFPGTPFKIGDGAAGLLRPDKFVAYFTSRERLDEVAAELHRELSGCEAHGVPFTAHLDDGGLLSWGVDPPDSDRALQWLRRESWRFWVAKRLAAAIAIAKRAHTAAAVEPWRFALERARRHGVDVSTWTPSARLWRTA